jgi:hypothetical protein
VAATRPPVVALFDNLTGNFNTATGAFALRLNTIGSGNTAIGVSALTSNATGSFNTASGAFTLSINTTGHKNTATGAGALNSNTIGFNNTANGDSTLVGNITASNNTANGVSALSQNTTGNSNTADGFEALFHNTDGELNTATGFHALFNNATGNRNIAFGFSAGSNLTTGSNNIDIGNVGVADESNTTRIGSGQSRTFIAGIRGRMTGNANAIPVLIDSAGQLGTMSSSRRYKSDIELMDKASEAILALKPVTFHYKRDNTRTPQFGLIAEEVAGVNPNLVVRDENDEIYTVRYEAVNAMLLNEFLKEHKTVQEQGAIIAQIKSNAAKQEAIIAQQQKQIEALTATVQKASAQLEVNKAAPQTVLNNE